MGFRIRTDATRNINWSIMDQLIFFRHMPNMFRRLSMRMRVEPCHAESKRSHAEYQLRHYAAVDIFAERAERQNTTTKNKRKKKIKDKNKKKDQRTRAKEDNTNTRNTTRARTQQQHPQTKTKTQEKIRCASCTPPCEIHHKRRISNEIKHT